MIDIFADQRDGNMYKIVEINGQVWMAENLRYEGVEHYVPDGDKNNIAEYGCLYKWEDAIKACPEGWHLPKKADFESLLSAVGKSDSERSHNLRASAFASGADAYGFGALPAGSYYYYDGEDSYDEFGSMANFWSAMESERDADYAYGLYFDNIFVYAYYNSKFYAFSVRCVKD